MKTLIMIVMSSIILACNANKNVSNDKTSNHGTSLCPVDGTCTFEVLRDKNFNMKADKFGNPYSELVDGDNIVLKFEYKRNTSSEGSVQDDYYSEVVYLEIDDNLASVELEGDELSSVNAGFARLCYCKGQTGTYPIKSGKLKIIELESNSYNVIFDFSVSEVPQIINSINESFELKKSD